MTNKNYYPKKVTDAVCLAISALAVFAMPAAFANTANGLLTMNIDGMALATLKGTQNRNSADENGKRYLYVEEFLDQSYNGDTISGANPDPTPGVGMIPSQEFQFAVNGSAIDNPNPDRLLQSTTLQYTDDPTLGSGQIGLSGAIRVRSDLFNPGKVGAGNAYYGWMDMSLKYDPSRVNVNGLNESGWVLSTNLSETTAVPAGYGEHSLFDLVDVTTSTVDGALSLSGNLIFGQTDWGQYIRVAPNEQARVIGNVTLQPVPVPAAVWLFGSALLSLASFKCRVSLQA